ncbi:hypothetical protein E3Q17_03212 [Wallemia mellicola]|uniref:Uncharacterized protein n=1 Tax=Wallemia mellicola TaxID=1708541 RepID=A0A4T0NL16_9BASI|nr:hypothetical protein E3Q17_03212 [Wallemia mellicola]
MDTPPEHRDQIEQLKGADILDINDLISIRDQLNNDSLDIHKDDLLAISKKLLTHSFEIQKLDLNKKSLITKNNIGKIELESLKRQAEALSWKLERSRWDARLTRWEAHDEVEPQGTSILHQDIETENRMLVGDKRVLKTKLEEALKRSNRLENELRQIRATLITKAHPGIEAWKEAAWHDGDATRSDQYGMGDARAEHLLLASKRLNNLIRRSQNPDSYQSLQPKQISRRKAMHSASSSTPKQMHQNGLENLINAATSVFDQPTRSSSRSPLKLQTRIRSPSPQVSPKRRKLPSRATAEQHEYVTGGDNRNEDPYLHYNASPVMKQQQQKSSENPIQGSALDFLADHAVEQSQNEMGTPNSSYALPPKLNALERDRDHINELGPPLKLRGSSPQTPSSPALESPSKPSRFTPSSAANSPRIVKAETTTPQIPPFVVQQPQAPHPSATFNVPPAGFTSTRPSGPSANSRAPYTKWTGAEDALLAKAVSIHGQKWDAVSKMVGTRSYHQVRQRYLRKSGQNPTPKAGHHNLRNSNTDRDDDSTDSPPISASSTPQPPSHQAHPIRAKEPTLPLTEHHTIKGVSGHELDNDPENHDRRVLIAYDESSESKGALQHYIDYIAQDNDHIFLVTVLRPLERHLDYSVYCAEEEATDAGRKIDPRIGAFFRDRNDALKRLKEERERITPLLAPRNITLTLHVAHGDPRETIPRVSKWHSAQLIIVGKRTLGRWQKIFHPSVSLAVIEHTKTSVLVVQ